jgi:predicted PurR-regulated permease PerM
MLVAMAAGAVILWGVSDVAMTAFAGILLAIALRALADILVRYARLPAPASLAAAVILIVAGFGLALWLIGDTLSTQFGGLLEQLPGAIEDLRGYLAQYPSGRALVGSLGAIDGVESVARLAGLAISTMGALANGLLIVALGIYFAVDPSLYLRGAVQLVPRHHRPTLARALRAAGAALRRWLGGQLVAMATVGIATGLGLWALGVPFAFSLGTIAGLLEFIAFLGPVAAAVPALLVAFAESPTMALYVAVLYLAVQQLEGYVLMPLIQRWAVALPPALAILVVVVLGVLLGLPGILFGLPLLVAALAIADSLRDES